MKNLCHKNNVVRNIFQSSLCNDTLLGNNIRYILYKCGYTREHIRSDLIDAKTLCNKIIEIWKDTQISDNVKLGTHIFELAKRRDSLEPWLLTKAEIQGVIDMLATS